HRVLAGLHRPWRQARDGALGGAAPDHGGRFQVLRRQRAAVPVVALHAVALAGDQRQAEVVVAAALGAEEAVAVGVDRQAFAGADVGALGIADARIGLAAGGLGLAGQGDRRFRV